MVGCTILLVAYFFIAFGEIQANDHVVSHRRVAYNSVQTKTRSRELSLNGYNDNPHRFEQSELPAALQRYKRNENSNQKQQYTIEIIVGYDDTFQRFHRHLDRDRLNEYILLLMKMASNILADKSIGNYPIGIHVIDIIATNNLNAERVVGSDIEMDADDLRQKFIDYLTRSGKKKYDAAIILTKNDLCKCVHKSECDVRVNWNCDIIGRANVLSICKPMAVVIKDEGLYSAFTIAHELGHVLGLNHENTEETSMMSTDANWVSLPWTSESSHKIMTLLKSKRARCLLDTGSVNMLSGFPLKESYFSVKSQCSNLGVREEELDMHRTMENFKCSETRCFRKNDEKEHYNGRRWADNTECVVDGYNKGLCQNSECQKGRKHIPKPKDERNQPIAPKYEPPRNNPVNYVQSYYKWQFTAIECRNGVGNYIGDCIHVKTNQKVGNQFCSKRPSFDSCNRDSDSFISWELREKSACSVECGRGNRTISHTCNLRYTGSDPSQIPDGYCSNLARSTMEECFETCENDNSTIRNRPEEDSAANRIHFKWCLAIVLSLIVINFS